MCTRNSSIVRRFLNGLAVLVCISLLASCVEGVAEDLTALEPYSINIGSEYVTSTEVTAYGIYRDLNEKNLSYVTLISGIGISGPEIAFAHPIPKNTKLKILSAWKERKLIGSNIYYLIKVQDPKVSSYANVRIELSLGQNGNEGALNSSIYRKLAR